MIFLSEGGDDVKIYLTCYWDMHSVVTNCWNISEKNLTSLFLEPLYSRGHEVFVIPESTAKNALPSKDPDVVLEA